MLKKSIVICMWLISMNVNSQTLKTSTIDSFQVNLIRYENVYETVGIVPLEKPSTFFSLIEIRKHGKLVSMGGNYSLSKDSCTIKFFELSEPRIKNGKVGTFYTLGLRTKKIDAKTISKPSWNYNDISNATIRPLDSLYYNPYNQNEPFVIPNFERGEKMALHPKMIEGFLIFFNDCYIIAPYYANEFPAPHNPHFEINLTYNGIEKSVLMYWGRYIVDGYVYTGEGSFIEPSDLRFWEANLKLLGLN